MEEWKPIEGYEKYSVSNFGNIKGPRGLMKLRNHTAGYCNISLGRNNQFLVHRLVAKAFCTNPLGKPHVDHIDRNKKNNNSSNLRWVTRSENMQNVEASYISVSYRVSFTRNNTRTRASFKTLEEAQQFLKENLIPI